MATLTVANSSINLSFEGLFDATPLQGYTADNIFDVADLSNAEVVMGIDGKLSYAWKPAPVVQTFSLQANSPSCQMFDTAYDTEQTNKEKLRVQAVIAMPGQGLNYTMANGVVTTWNVMPSAHAMAQPRKFTITWESRSASPL